MKKVKKMFIIFAERFAFRLDELVNGAFYRGGRFINYLTILLLLIWVHFGLDTAHSNYQEAGHDKFITWITAFVCIVFGSVCFGINLDKDTQLRQRKLSNYIFLAILCWSVTALFSLYKVNYYDTFWLVFLSNINSWALLSAMKSVFFTGTKKPLPHKLLNQHWAILNIIIFVCAIICAYTAIPPNGTGIQPIKQNHIGDWIDFGITIITLWVLGSILHKMSEQHPFPRLTNIILIAISFVSVIIQQFIQCDWPPVKDMGGFTNAWQLLYKITLCLEFILLIVFYDKLSSSLRILTMRKDFEGCGNVHYPKARERAKHILNKFLNFTDNTVFSVWTKQQRELFLTFLEINKNAFSGTTDLHLHLKPDLIQCNFWKEIREDALFKSIQNHDLRADLLYLIIYAALTNDGLPKEMKGIAPKDIYQLSEDEKKAMDNVTTVRFELEKYWDLLQSVYNLFKSISERADNQGGCVSRIYFHENKLVIEANDFNIVGLKRRIRQMCDNLPTSDKRNTVSYNILKISTLMRQQYGADKINQLFNTQERFYIRTEPSNSKRPENGQVFFYFDFTEMGGSIM